LDSGLLVNLVAMGNFPNVFLSKSIKQNLKSPHAMTSGPLAGLFFSSLLRPIG